MKGGSLLNDQMTVTLNDGNVMPRLGLGVYRASEGGEVENAVKTAIEAGYRLIDTASLYQNEAGVGRAIKASVIDRSELFITTKLWNTDQRTGNVRPAFMASLQRLGLEYVDLYLIHWPMPDVGLYVETWKEFEKLQADGLVKSIGVSNFTIETLEELKKHSDIIPAVNQIELHPYLPQHELRDYAKANGIQIESWRPIGGGQSGLLEEAVIRKLAEKYEKSPAQIVLRWHLQNDLVAIPKSSHDERIKENFDVFDFELTPDDMEALNSLEDGRRFGPDPRTMNTG